RGELELRREITRTRAGNVVPPPASLLPEPLEAVAVPSGGSSGEIERFLVPERSLPKQIMMSAEGEDVERNSGNPEDIEGKGAGFRDTDFETWANRPKRFQGDEGESTDSREPRGIGNQQMGFEAWLQMLKGETNSEVGAMV